MTTIDTNENLALFNNLKKSIDDFYSKNAHLESSGVFSMREILINCEKLEHFLYGDFQKLWRLEREETRILRQKLENIPVEVVHETNHTDTDNMPPLIPCEESMIEQDLNEAFSVSENNTSTPLAIPTTLRTSVWNWAPSYNPASALAFSQQVRDL